MQIDMRFCRLDDFVSIFDLLKQLWPNMDLDYKNLQTVYELAISSDKQKLIIGLINNQVVGFCSLTIKNNLWQAGNLGHVDELVVDESARGQGIGKILIDKITEIAIQNKCKRIELDSAFHRKDAHKFYEKIGYENRAYLFSKILDN
jgi:ribosomal protein S18 acetylase RimI-like enzyme